MPFTKKFHNFNSSTNKFRNKISKHHKKYHEDDMGGYENQAESDRNEWINAT